ncbi:MAG: caspase family protein [Desulfamplus sp.]|nr:caspase family protein [Desulfamplus sp.]
MPSVLPRIKTSSFPGVFVITLVSLCGMLFFNISDALGSKRTALVIGNADYSTSPLKNPVNDAEDMASRLKQCDFEVIKLTNADRRSMIKAVDAFYKNLRGAEVGLFYYAGHGVQVNGRNFLIPVDAHVTSESDVELESLDARRVLGKMNDAGNPLNIVILDACRDNPFERSFRTGSSGLARMDAPRGAIIAYATAPGAMAADGDERNGVFTGSFMEHMLQPGWGIERVLKETRKNVIDKTNGKQVPWDSSSLTGDFYFAKGTTVVDTPSPEPSSSGDSHSVKGTGSLKIQTNPPGAEIGLMAPSTDELKAMGRSPLSISHLAPGRYTVKAVLQDYEPHEKKIQVNADRTALVTFYLDPVVTKSKLYVNTMPLDSLVRIMNIVPRFYNGIELEAGRYDVEVSKNGYISRSSS